MTMAGTTKATIAAVLISVTVPLSPAGDHFSCDNLPWARQHPIECGFVVGPRGDANQGCGGLCGVVRSILRHLPLL